MGIFLGDFDDVQDVCQQFDVDKKELEREGVYILLAIYEQESYEGSAFVLFIKDDRKLYEVNGGHCSCYGLEGQWDPEETSEEALRHRMKEGYFGYDWNGQPKFKHAMECIFNMLPILQAGE